MPSPFSQVFIFILSLFFLLSTSNIVHSVNRNTKPSSNSLIEKACSNTSKIALDSRLCTRVLVSQPQIVAAKNFFDLSIKIIAIGISNTTRTCKYVQDQLQKPNLPSDYKDVLYQCNSSYFSSIMSFRSALEEVRDHKDYEIGSYDLLIASTDDINGCRDAIDKSKIKDESIVNGITYVQVFGLSAFQVVNILDIQYKTRP